MALIAAAKHLFTGDTAHFWPRMKAVDGVCAKQPDSLDRLKTAYPFHPDLLDRFFGKWTDLDQFQRTRGVLQTFAMALRDAEGWDKSLCLSQIPVEGGRGRRIQHITPANQRRQIKVSFDCSPGLREGPENPRCGWRIERSCRIDQRELTQHSLRGIARRTSTFRLRAARTGGEHRQLAVSLPRSQFRRVYGPRFRRVLGQREVCPGFVIIRHE